MFFDMDVLILLQKLDVVLVEANQVFINNLVVLLFSIAAFLHRKNDNILFFIALILFPSILDILFFNEILLSGIFHKSAPYLFYLFFDSAVIVLILYRAEVYKKLIWLKLEIYYLFKIYSRTEIFVYARHINEYKIITVFALSVIYNVFMFAEYPYRSYINKNALYIYYLYTPFKLILNVAVLYFIFTMRSTDHHKVRSSEQ